MKKSGSRNYVIRKKYLLLTTVMIIMSIVFLSLVNLNRILVEKEQEVHNEFVHIELEKVYEERQSDDTNQVHRQNVYLLDPTFEYLVPVLNFQKMEPIIIDDIADLSGIQEESFIILSGDNLKDEVVYEQINALSQQGEYYFIVDVQNMEHQSEKVNEFLGILSINEKVDFEGIRILDNFWFDKVIEEKEYFDTARQLEIKAGRPVYITSYAQDYDKEETIPLLHRNMYKKAHVYVVNGSFLQDFPQGILRGIMSQTKESYLYPIVDTSYMAAAPLPVLSQENTEVLKTEYFRDMRQLTDDILIPDIQFLASDFNQKLTLFAKEYLQDPNAAVTPSMLSDIQKLILKKDGELGIWITDENEARWKNWVKEYFEKEKVSSIMLNEIDKQIEEVSEGLIGYVHFDSENILPINIQENKYVQHSIPLILNEDEGKMRLNYLSSLFGYGISSMGLNLEDILMATGEKWNVVSREISENVKGFMGFTKSILQPMTIEEATMQAIIYDLMEPEIYYSESEIEVHISYFSETASFMLKTKQTVKNVINGNARQVGDGYYIIKFNQKYGIIELESEWQKFQEE